MATASKLPLTWDIPPLNGHDVYFSRDIYEKYSLAPTLAELLLLPKRHTEDNANASNSGQKSRTSNGRTAGKPVKGQAEPSANIAPFQEPRVPYPHFSSLTEKEQRRYLFQLSKDSHADPHLQMREFVSKEVAEFLKFAQNAARSCTKDYETFSAEAALYTQQFLSSCIGYVKKYPECYTLHEVTSIMGGRFSTELTLKLEKSLLTLGKVNLIKRKFAKLPVQLLLPADHKNEFYIAAPEQRASMLHKEVSTDPNAEKLAGKYCPQVVLTSESLYTLLNNHGSDYKNQWELPVSVKVISSAGCKPVKVVYIDPPLPRKEMTVREKNQIFHEFLADFHMTRQSYVLARAAILDKPHEELVDAKREACQSRQIPDSGDLDFDTDVTELETFGSVAEGRSSIPSCCSDTDEEPLIIDTAGRNHDNAKSSPVPSNQEPIIDPPEIPCTQQPLSGKLGVPAEIPDQEVNASKKPCQRLSKKLDPVGQILKMQTELLRVPSPKGHGQAQMNSERSLNRTPCQECPTSKASSSSALEPGSSTTADTGSSRKFTWTSCFQGSQKGLLWDGVEDHSAYETPQQGNLVYKLFSLDDLLLLVRCTVQKLEPRPRSKEAVVKRHFPVYALPKLEYQAFYGAEALTEGEICRMWTESLLHSSSSFVVGHIDALTSKLFLLEEISAENLKKRFGTFKPTNSLNILQHILKKVAG
ncbi:little elongation complex subunit 2 isoform X2 [Hemicordylus capensis]|nr:little elongation complex subunit 2 isoform X2 [Hemicordylus capensis]